MINKTLINRAISFLKNRGMPVDSLVITDQAAMVMSGHMQSCSILNIAVPSHSDVDYIRDVFPYAVEDITEGGNITITTTIIKGLLVVFTSETIANAVTAGETRVIRDVDNIERLRTESPRDALRIEARMNGESGPEEDIEQLRAFYRGVEDLAKIRVQSGQRVLSCFKHKLGVSPGESEDKIASKLKIIEDNYRMLTDGAVSITKSKFNKNLKSMDTSGVYIDSYSEMLMVSTYINIRDEEELATKRLRSLLTGIPIWDEFLVHVRGCGVKMGAAIISELNIKAASYPSSFWKYLGLDVVKDPETGEMVGRRNWTHLMEDAEFLNKAGEVTEAKYLGYNPKLKSKLVFVMGGCMLKANGYYRWECYEPYKHRLFNRRDLMDVTDDTGKVIKSLKGKRHAMAQRYMVKQMISDLFCEWKLLDGGTITAPYGVAKLGRKEHSRRTFRECLAMAKIRGGNAEDYIGSVTGEEPMVPGVYRCNNEEVVNV